MSKQKIRIHGTWFYNVVSALAIGSCFALIAVPVNTQNNGFSIFEPGKGSAESSDEVEAPVVAPKEVFTNPNATLPKSQFGPFGEKSTNGFSKPQLNGSKPEGTYAHDGRNMFREPPTIQAASISSKLQPLKPNHLRAANRSQLDRDVKVESKPAPIVVGDFPKSARPLATASSKAINVQPEQPKIAQVAFQDNGFTSRKRPQGEGVANRFNQSTGSRFNPAASASPAASPSTASRFSSTTSNSGLSGTARRQPQPQPRQQLGQTTRQQGMPSAMSVQSTPAVTGGFSNMRPRQNKLMPQNQTNPPRTAALTQQPQPVRRANTVATNNKTINSVGAKAAKELLSSWAQANPELKLPGKQMKLHEFLAKPINGLRKDAINQYWLTFADMANYKLAVEQAQWLSSIAKPRQQSDQAVLKAAQQAAQNRVLHTEIQLAKSQSMLGDFLPSFRYKNGKSIPVLPSDTPWVGKLNTKLAEYQKRGIVPNRFNSIDDILPKARQLIANRADAVNAASRAAQQAKSAMKNGQSSIASVLEAARMKSKNQQDFLANVTGYNRAITDYVLSVRQDISQPKRLASVLIGRKAVQSKVAKKEKPREGVDSFLSDSDTPIQQVSSQQRVQLQKSSKSQEPQNLVGKSAYQIEGRSSGMEQGMMNPLSPEGSAKSEAAAVEKPSFAYGPTKESAAAANFDPAKVKAELPMQQAKSKGTSPIYNGGTARNSGVRPVRSANNSSKNQRQDTFRNRGGKSALGGLGATGQSAPQPSAGSYRPSGPSPTNRFAPTDQQSSGSPFPPRPRGGEAGTTPAIPKSPATDPFQSTSSKPSQATGASTSSRVGGAFGGFKSGTQQPSSTASRFGVSGGAGLGESTRR